MRRKIAPKMLDVSEAVLKTEEYCRLLEEYRRLDKEVLRVYAQIQPRQRDVLMACMGTMGVMNQRLLEQACRETIMAEGKQVGFTHEGE